MKTIIEKTPIWRRCLIVVGYSVLLLLMSPFLLPIFWLPPAGLGPQELNKKTTCVGIVVMFVAGFALAFVLRAMGWWWAWCILMAVLTVCLLVVLVLAGGYLADEIIYGRQAKWPR